MPYPHEPRTLGEHLKKRRHELELRQKDVAARLWVNEWTIVNWEKDKTQPSVRYLPRIIDFLGYDPYPAPQSLADELVAQRRRLGLSRKRLARKLTIDEGTLTRWENEQSCPTGKWLLIVEQFLST